MRLGQTETAKKGSPRLLIALVVLSLVVTTVYMREGDTGFLHAGKRLAVAITAPASRIGMLLTTPLRAIGNGLSGLGVNRREVEQLRTQNRELRNTVTALEEARLQNERVNSLVAFAQKHDLAGVGATIIGRSTDSWEGSIQIDRGTADGVREGMPVLADGGLLGQVVEASGQSSRVRLITDQRSGVAALVQRTRASGIVRGSIEGELGLDFVNAKQTPKVGDVVISSGMGGVYPKGLIIGDVSHVSAPRGELFPTVVVTSRVEIGRVEEVMVLTGRKGDEE